MKRAHVRAGMIAALALFQCPIARADNPGGPAITNRDAQARTVLLTCKKNERRVVLKHGKGVQLSSCETVSLGDQVVEVNVETQYFIKEGKITGVVLAL